MGGLGEKEREEDFLYSEIMWCFHRRDNSLVFWVNETKISLLSSELVSIPIKNNNRNNNNGNKSSNVSPPPPPPPGAPETMAEILGGSYPFTAAHN